MFQVTCLKILGRVGTYIFLIIFFLEKNIILCILKGHGGVKSWNFFNFILAYLFWYMYESNNANLDDYVLHVECRAGDWHDFLCRVANR